MLLAVRLGQPESHEDWLELGRDLTRRGLRAPWLVVSDGAPGLIKAIEELWPEADRGRCAVHKLRNLVAKLPKRPGLHDQIKAAYWAALDEATDPADAERYTPSFRTGITGYQGVAANVYEVGDTYRVTMLIPGVDPNSVEVTALGNTITVAGSVEVALPEGAHFVWQEFYPGPAQFRREITLPVEVDPTRIEASYQNGVLMLSAPKAEHAKPRQIQVRS